MKFTISGNELLRSLMDVSKAIPVKTALPILENFLFVLTEEGLEITASDQETTLRTVISVSSIEETGSIAIPAKNIIELLKTLPDQPIEIKTLSESTYECNWQSGKSILPYFPATDYPNIESIGDDAQSVKIPAQVLLEGINNTVYATSDEELRPIMNGIFFDIDTDKTTFVGTDSHKLICYTSSKVIAEQKSELILHKKVANILKSLIAKEEGDVDIKFNEKSAEFQYGHNIVICRLIIGKYPAYRTVIPQNNSNILTIDRHTLINIIKRVSVCANKASNHIKFELHEGQLEVTAQDLSFSLNAYEKVACDYSGETLTVGLRANFLTEMLSNINSQNITMKFADNKTSVLVMPDEQEDISICGILMPVII